mgnify:CR=1 FL=1
MTATEQRIREFADLGPDWDSYGAVPIAADVIERAIRALGALVSSYRFWPVPCSDGGILFEGLGPWEDCDLKVEP